MGAVLVCRRVADTVRFGDHGSTFGGGMLAMAALHATLSVLVNDGLMRRARAIFERIQLSVEPVVEVVLGKGCLIGLRLDREAAPVLERLREFGVLAGGCNDPQVIRLMPPLTTPDHAVGAFIEAFYEALEVSEVSA